HHDVNPSRIVVRLARGCVPDRSSTPRVGSHRRRLLPAARPWAGALPAPADERHRGDRPHLGLAQFPARRLPADALLTGYGTVAGRPDLAVLRSRSYFRTKRWARFPVSTSPV